MVAAAVLLVCGANWMDPFFYALRPWIAPAILGAGAVGLIRIWRSPSRSVLHTGLWLAIPVSILVVFAGCLRDRLMVSEATEDDIAALGRHFVVGYADAGQVAPLAGQGLIGGIVLNRRNIRHRTEDQVRAEIAQLQAIRHGEGQPALIVATDQEGGSVSHLSPILPAMPSLSEIATLPDPAGAARAYGAEQGRGLAEVGVNVDFSPVLDLKPNGPMVLDHNSLIGKRAISADPAVVATVGSAYAKGLADAGVIATAKHFPGLGRIRVDTHIFAAGTRVGMPQFQQADWIPFRQVLETSDAFLMLGHVTLKAIDADNPASHSKRVVQGLIRDAWNYRGIVITDDLDMGAIYHHGFCNAVVQSLNAGVDLLLIAYDGQQYYRAMACALDALHRGTIDRAMLEDSDRRLRGLRLGGEEKTLAASSLRSLQ
jgi:beta-N-acetylhexosaminidase